MASEQIDLSEKGRTRTGETITSNRRLYMQLLAFGGCSDSGAVADELERQRLPAVLYDDLNDPWGIGLLAWSETPDFFLDAYRAFLRAQPIARLTPKPELTMFGRSYSMGWEQDLEEALIRRPIGRVCDPPLRWALWYPLRRTGAFEQLDVRDQHEVLSEHGSIGQSYGRAGIAHDVRLACHGLMKDDNDFLIGVLSGELHPLSAVVQRMRKTKQTSLYIERLGPFFVGRARWQPRTA